jgi:hypothetical protein
VSTGESLLSFASTANVIEIYFHWLSMIPSVGCMVRNLRSWSCVYDHRCSFAAGFFYK